MAIHRLVPGLYQTEYIDTDRLPEGWKVRYGRVFKPGATYLQIELQAFRDDWKAPFGLGRLEHFKRIVTTLWPHYAWHDWWEEMAAALCSNDLVAFMGCAGSGKSKFLAIWALVNWWAAPQDTAVAVTSTDIEGAKGRVWGHIVTAFREAEWIDDNGVRGEPPGKITDQPPQIRLSETTDDVRGAGQESIKLVAAGNENLNAALKVLQGLHNMLVLVIYDELQDLGAAVIGDALLQNFKRNPRFQLCAAGNIGDPDDPLGTFCRPVTPENRGYDDVNVDTKSWSIRRAGKDGICVRFDAEDSPNVKRSIAGLAEHVFLPTVFEIEQMRENFARGEVDLAAYYRQWRAFVAPRNAEDGRYSAAAILKFKAADRVRWKKPDGYVALGSADPAYTSGGDRFMLTIAHYGLSEENIWTIEFVESAGLQHDPADGELRNYALVRQAKRICQEKGVEARYFGVDTSAANPIGDIFAQEWSDEILRVDFQGKASVNPVSMTDHRPGHDVYANKCAELWCLGANYLRHSQLRNVTKQHEKELAARRTWTAAGNRIQVESKKDMKRRLGYSPDIADGGNIILEVARERLGAIAGAEGVAARVQSWGEVARQTNVQPIRLFANRGIATYSQYAPRRR